MSDEKPLHVRVAEALGCKVECVDAARSDWRCRCPIEISHFDDNGKFWRSVSAYDTDWSATGPLIEKYAITCITPFLPSEGKWEARVGRPSERHMTGFGSTPLVAICNLILALKEAGKL